MDSQERALLDEIVENPDDDMPRLIYADWLEERGNPRAEFIRVQCELVNPGGPLEDLRRREKSLLAEHRAEWLGQLGLPLMWYAFRRGFVEDVIVHPQNFIEQNGRILEVSPIHHLRISFRSMEQIVGFAQVASLRHLRGLHLSARLKDRILLSPLLSSPHLVGLQELFLSDIRLEHSDIVALRRGNHALRKRVVSCSARRPLQE